LPRLRGHFPVWEIGVHDGNEAISIPS
jgi:hypothetical protein